MTTAERELAALGRRPCPPLGEMLTALAAVWRPVERAALDGGLDELARPLFAAAPEGEARARALAGVVGAELRLESGPPAGLHLDAVLATRSGHPLLIASLAVELGRRAGWETTLCSTPTAWFAGLVEEDRLWLVEPTDGDAGPPPTAVRRHCAHELAYAVLTGLAERLPDPEASRALVLRRRVSPDPAGADLLGSLRDRPELSG